MALSPNKNTREFEKFKDTAEGTAVKTSIVEGAITGEFVFSGLKIGGKITHVSLTDAAWTAMPTTPLANRNNVTIQNISDNGNTILWNYSNTAPATEGFRIYDGGFKSVALASDIVVYCRMLAGSGTACVDEVA